MKTLKIKSVGITVALLAIVAGITLFLGNAYKVLGGSIVNESLTSDNFQRYYTFLSATTTTATSTNITAAFDADGRRDTGALQIAGADRVSFMFQRGDTSGQGNAGSSQFFISASHDDSTWFTVNRFIGNDVSNTATSSYTLVGTSTAVVSMDLTNASYKSVRCIVVELTDGEHTCKAFVDF